MTLSDHQSPDELKIRMQERIAELEKELIEIKDKLEAEIRDTRILHKLSTKHVEGGDLSQIFQEILEAAIEITGAEKGNIQIIDPSTGKLEIAAQRGFDPTFIKSFECLDIEEAAPYKIEVERMEGVRAVQSTPLVSRSGEPLGTISTFFSRVHTPTERELIFIDILARQAADIIERKQAEEGLFENREDLDHTQTVGNIGSWRLNVHKNELTWSDENYRIFGIPRGTPLTYETFLSTIHPDDKEFVDKNWNAILTGETQFDIEHRIIVEGKIKWVYEKAHLEFDKNGTLFRGFGITQDITESKQAEKSLRQSEQRIRLKLESILSPEEEIGKLELAEIIDTLEVQSLMNDFYKLAHYGFNEKEYMAALEKVPRLSRKTVDTGMSFFMKLANMFSQLSYINIKLTRSLAERDALVGALRESERRERARSEELEAVLDAVPAAVWKAHDSRALLITGNRLSYEWLRVPEGTNVSKSDSGGEKLTFKVFKDEMEIPIADMPLRISAAGKELKDYEFGIMPAGGEMRHLLGNARSLRDENGNPRGSVSVFIDITERKKTEETLKKTYEILEEKIKERTAELEEAYKVLEENERRLSEAQKMAHIGIWDWDFVTDEMYWSEETYRIFGLIPRKSSSSYSEVLSCTHPDDREYVNNAVKKALKGKPFSIDQRIISADGEVRVIHVQGEVVFDEKYIPIRMRGTVQNITENKKAEEKIQILADAVESSDDAIVTESLDGIITSWNKGAEQIYGYSAEEIMGKNASILETNSLKGEIKQLIEKVKQREKIRHYRTLRLKKDGTVINVSVTLSPIFDSSEKFAAVSCIARDITERIKAEEALAKIEDARKKEIHHRIKNNLQVISSLLDLQAEKFSFKKIAHTKEILEAFRESQNRVISMSLIHEELYKGEGDDTLDFSAYLRKLAGNLFRTYSLNSRNIRLSMDLEENAFFNMDTAIPLGIIVNELVSNSLKHAFGENQEGEIRVRLCRKEENDEIHKSLFSLIISDNGKGIPENIELSSLESLGLQLVSTLVDQLDGKIEIRREQGTEFRITLKTAERINSLTKY